MSVLLFFFFFFCGALSVTVCLFRAFLRPIINEATADSPEASRFRRFSTDVFCTFSNIADLGKFLFFAVEYVSLVLSTLVRAVAVDYLPKESKRQSCLLLSYGPSAPD